MDEFSGVYVRDCNRMFKPRESAFVGRRAVVHVPRSGVSRLLLERTPTKTTKKESGRGGGGGGGKGEWQVKRGGETRSLGRQVAAQNEAVGCCG